MTNTDDVWKRFCDIAAINFKGSLSRRDRIAMMFALECLRRQDVDRGMAVTSALHVLSYGGAESRKLKEAAVPAWYETTLRARLALALRVLLRVDEHSACDKHTSCCSSVGVYSPCPYRLEDASDPDSSGIPRRIHPLWEDAPTFDPNVTPAAFPC